MAKSFPIFDLILLCFPDERSILSTSNNVTKLTSFIWSINLERIRKSRTQRVIKKLYYASLRKWVIRSTSESSISEPKQSKQIGGTTLDWIIWSLVDTHWSAAFGFGFNHIIV